MNASPFRRFLALTIPQRGPIILGVLLILAATLLMLPAPWILKLIIDDALPGKNMELMVKLLAAFTGLFMLRAWLTLVRNRILQFAAMRLVCDIRIKLFAHLQSLSLRYFDTNQTGRTIGRITQDTNEVYALTNGFLITVIADSVTVVCVLGFLFWIEWHLALAVTAVLPLFVFNYLHHRKRMRQESRAHRDNWDKVMGFLNERVAAARVVKSFAKEQDEISSFAGGINADYFNFSRIVMRNTKLSVVADLLGSLGALVVLAYGGWMVMQGQMEVGTLVAFNAYITFIFPPIVRFVDLSAIFQRANTGLENIFTMLDTKPEVADAADAKALPALRGELEFRDVGFDYDLEMPGKGRPRTLSNVSFNIPAGKIVAIVGPSGSGKSTIINLIARFYDVASGAVLVDGHDIRTVTTDSLRKQIGIVLQESVLFSGTLEDNIKYGRPDATREQILDAANAANAHEFITKLPDGYATVVGERGSKLSGGQRQRIAIARAILKDPRILIFDEATSALDTQSERLIQQAMERLMQNRTSFIIAHRLSTIQNADIILVMDQGRLAEMGTHAELLTKDGLYSRLHALQFKDPA
ncbi:ABC transporter ATP-binding protein [Rariglobus hedericola]|uniref:ABC transporter ATP-binding protein n=1 Tax=Rariglobus hedericola TaxID=2597822 RepID=A0A556QGF3_9BACT|nr:ABC transporter ATP-binding protein [Rariglobus hedericola]TSJ75720.1 ABC transporter ATP-binding protein [Rariglobus hedericola]